MKYTLNRREVEMDFNQASIKESQIENKHHDFIDPKMPWYKKGYIRIEVSESFLNNIRSQTLAYVNKCLNETVSGTISSLSGYHHLIQSDDIHQKVLQRIGKILPSPLLGIDEKYLEKKIQEYCHIPTELSCLNVCDLRIFRPYTGGAMDNNPLHRDTWLPILNNCINVYIPIAGNNRLSSLTVVPGSHLWSREKVERTVDNAKINGVQYGLPSVTAIKRKYKVVRPTLSDREVLLFSSNIIHGGAVNLNKDLTRTSIEIRFWIKSALTEEHLKILHKK